MGTRSKSKAHALAAVLTVATLQVQAQEPALAAEELFERISPSVWLVQTADRQGKGLAMGSAVVIGPGVLITNCHVLKEAGAVEVHHGTTRHNARLQYADPERDLCQLNAPGVAAPAVRIANPKALRVGAKVYAIGNPRGLELTLSDGLLSGLRHDARGALEALQISVPISPGSSGGGLFDTRGRLIGITTWGLKESQNLNFAVPANWIAEVPMRAGYPAAVSILPEIDAFPPVVSPPAGVAAAVRTPRSSRLAVGTAFEYRLTDRLTGISRNVTYQIDRIDGERVIFNQGSRVENLDGEVLSMSAPIGGEVDAAMPPGGWVKPGTKIGSGWRERFAASPLQQKIGMDLEAKIVEEAVLSLVGQQMRTLRVQFTGFTDRGITLPANASGRYRAVVWYAPDLGRVVRFEVYSKGGSMSSAYVIDEIFELVDIR